MAKLETTLTGNFHEILQKIENGVLHGSVSASLEDASDFKDNDSRCSVVSLNDTVMQGVTA